MKGREREREEREEGEDFKGVTAKKSLLSFLPPLSLRLLL
jgi:hypothetical protein